MSSFWIDLVGPPLSILFGRFRKLHADFVSILDVFKGHLHSVAELSLKPSSQTVVFSHLFPSPLVSFELAVVICNLPQKCPATHQCWLETLNNFRLSLSKRDFRDGDSGFHVRLQSVRQQVFTEATNAVGDM